MTFRTCVFVRSYFLAAAPARVSTRSSSVITLEFVRYALSHASQMQAILSGFYPFDPPTLRAELLKIDSENSGGKQPETLGQNKVYQSTSKEVETSLSR